MVALGAERSPEAGIQNIFVKLDRKKLLGDTPPKVVSAEDRLALLEIDRLLAKAKGATDADDAKAAMTQALVATDAFLKTNPEHVPVWRARALLALELRQSRLAWEAGRKLQALGGAGLRDAGVDAALVELKSRGLLGDQPPAPGPRPGEPWENSLGMKFVPVPGTGVLFSIWETRVQDFEAFVKATGHNAEAGMRSYNAAKQEWQAKGDTWRAPGFAQSPQHPVCGVNWDDAQAFCRWLTEKERREGNLGPAQEFRLPTDAEWSLAVGLGSESGSTPKAKDEKVPGVYPWGTQWPPPVGAGNFAGEGDNYVFKIDGYADGAARTAKAGSYAVNRLGIFDLAGNVWEWCEDFYEPGSAPRVLRGGSWAYSTPAFLLSSDRRRAAPAYRYDFYGFRCVVVAGGSSR
jgi:hypothetical protein